jgi:glycerol-3-phosphate acyltransferase PlsY
MFQELLLALGGYCIGALPVGAWIARYHGIQDITKCGSGSSGATNVGRFLGIHYFFLVFALDVFKAWLFMWLLRCSEYQSLTVALSAVGLLSGNSYSMFLRGGGGKGVATSFGILLALMPLLLLPLSIIWFSIFCFTRTVGTASVGTLLALPIIAFFVFDDWNMLFLLLFITVHGMYRHKDNIKQIFVVSIS